MILIISLDIDGIRLLESVTMISPVCSSLVKVKSAYTPGGNRAIKNQDLLWQKTTCLALNYSEAQVFSLKLAIPQNLRVF